MSTEPESTGRRTQDAGPCRALRDALCLLLAVGLVAGCSKKAIITKTDGSVVEAEIVRSDASTIYISTGRVILEIDGYVQMQESELARADIVDIDHPGNVGATIASVFTGVGVSGGLVLVIAACTCGLGCDKEETRCDDCGIIMPLGLFVAAPGAVLLVASLPNAIWGWVTYRRSKIRAAHSDDASAKASAPIRFLGIAPLVDSDRELKGLTLGFQF